MNFDRLRFVAERADLGEAARGRLRGHDPRAAGQLQGVLPPARAGNITEFNYRYADPTEAHVFVGLRCAIAPRRTSCCGRSSGAGITTLDLTDNEMAKLHVRHLVGGRARARDELLYRFEFPERPGALMRFLDAMSQRLEHQPLPLPQPRRRLRPRARRHPGAAGESARAFHDSLRKLGYPYVEETANPAAALFLGA